ncbi:unnamed protein product [Rotaria sordida]|uniref:Endonuclease/exonuclease/phosphatase domain-containing protein n=1 Tax=Rotaria sordida TaxID=392033 RepID=A0A818ZHM8_9BILA|nr:unnamed protein product [Rotaria sordida]CAF3769362.1 unnamed protein product [Rotaria sordida]
MTQRAAMTTFRIATINVHGFINPWTDQSNAQPLASILAPLELDLIAVEEATNDNNWRIFQDHLSLPYSTFGPSYGSTRGNAILSRHPIAYSTNVISDHRCRGGTRAMLHFSLDGNHPFVQNRTFAITHLDHINEDDRIVQMTSFAPHRNNINILMGDMNAVTREDYSDDYYQQIVFDKRKQAGWELPQFDLIRLITTSFAFQDAFRQANPKLKDEQTATCPYGTRIDYIFFRPLISDEWILKDCSLVDTKQATDHQAVMAIFEHQQT